MLTWHGFLWVLAGGIAYTVGIAFYAAKHQDLHALYLASLRFRRISLPYHRRLEICHLKRCRKIGPHNSASRTLRGY